MSQRSYNLLFDFSSSAGNTSVSSGSRVPYQECHSLIVARILCLDLSRPMPQFVIDGFATYDLTHKSFIYT